EEHYLELGKLSALAKPLARAHTASPEQINALNHSINHVHKEMRNPMKELGFISNSLQEEVRMLRLVPVSSLLHHLTRSVRNLAQELDKKIEFIIRGDNVRMDKLILEELK